MASCVFAKAQKDLGKLLRIPKIVTSRGHTYTENYYMNAPGAGATLHGRYHKWLNKVQNHAEKITGHSLHQLITQLRAAGHDVSIHDVLKAGGGTGHTEVDPETFATHLAHMAGGKLHGATAEHEEHHAEGVTAPKLQAAEKREGEAKGRGSNLDELAALRKQKWVGKARIERGEASGKSKEPSEASKEAKASPAWGDRKDSEKTQVTLPPRMSEHSKKSDTAEAPKKAKTAEASEKPVTRGVPVTVSDVVKNTQRSVKTGTVKTAEHGKDTSAAKTHVFSGSSHAPSTAKKQEKPILSEQAKAERKEHRVDPDKVGSTIADLKSHKPGTVLKFPGGSTARVTDDRKFAIHHPEHGPEEKTVLYSEAHPQLRRWELGLTKRQKLAQDRKKKKSDAASLTEKSQRFLARLAA